MVVKTAVGVQVLGKGGQSLYFESLTPRFTRIADFFN